MIQLGQMQVLTESLTRDDLWPGEPFRVEAGRFHENGAAQSPSSEQARLRQKDSGGARTVPPRTDRC